MRTYDVYHQHCPVKQSSEKGLMEPAIVCRGQVQAESGADAIEEAKRLKISQAPMVCPA